MKNETGKLKKTSKGFLVTLATKKGTADFQIPEAAQCFRIEPSQTTHSAKMRTAPVAVG